MGVGAIAFMGRLGQDKPAFGWELEPFWPSLPIEWVDYDPSRGWVLGPCTLA